MPIEDIPICSDSELNQVFEGELFQKWKKGEPTLLRVEPEHVETRIEQAVDSILVNNGSYEKGENVVIHSRSFCLPLAKEMGYVLEERGFHPLIVENLPSLSSLVSLSNTITLHT